LFDHPNIVKFIDFSETQNNIYFFLEYCNQGDLEKLAKQRGKLPEAEALVYFKQIVSGCKYLYDQNVIHRDLKPENILMHNNTCKIADFGFAKCIEEDKKDTASHGTAVGTPYFMSPQILSGDEYSMKCDVWSLGIMFYYILFGILPWKDSNSIT
jgi:serine/threonine protein kinase